MIERIVQTDAVFLGVAIGPAIFMLIVCSVLLAVVLSAIWAINFAWASPQVDRMLASVSSATLGKLETYFVTAALCLVAVGFVLAQIAATPEWLLGFFVFAFLTAAVLGLISMILEERSRPPGQRTPRPPFGQVMIHAVGIGIGLVAIREHDALLSLIGF